MEVMYVVCCDEGHAQEDTCLLPDSRGLRKEAREFCASTNELIELSPWLKETGDEMVVMEGAASYRKQLCNMLETQDNISIMNISRRYQVP